MWVRLRYFLSVLCKYVWLLCWSNILPPKHYMDNSVVCLSIIRITPDYLSLSLFFNKVIGVKIWFFVISFWIDSTCLSVFIWCNHLQVFFFLTNTSWGKLGKNIFHEIFCIIFWSNLCGISRSHKIIPNPPFHYSSPYLVIHKSHLRVLVILCIFRTMAFGVTEEASFRGTYFIYYDKINLQNSGKSWASGW